MRSTSSRLSRRTESKSGRSSRISPPERVWVCPLPTMVRMRFHSPGAGTLVSFRAALGVSGTNVSGVIGASAGSSSGYTRSETPSQSRTSSLPSLPHTAACAATVVGRVWAARASFWPATALKREDLPLPVAPKNPTIVCSAERLRRSRARLMVVALRSIRVVSIRPRPASSAALSESARSVSVPPRWRAMVVLEGTSSSLMLPPYFFAGGAAVHS